jgi:microcystin-dependent protein
VATVTSYTAARMKAIEDGTVVDGDVVGNNLILTKHDGSQIDAGDVRGPVGATGPKGDPGAPGASAISAIPGEMKLWPGTALPNVTKYGHWVWADGSVYSAATYPDAAAAIAAQWKTFAGASDPGAGNFRVPDMRGLVPAGMDAMPGGARANRMTRAAAITIAARTGEESHVISNGEMPRHNHGGSGSVSTSVSVNVGVNVSGGISGSADSAGSHQHTVPQTQANAPAGKGLTDVNPQYTNNILNKPGTGGTGFSILADAGGSHTHPLSGSFSGSGSGSGTGTGSGSATINYDGADTAHENVQPTVFVPYIVFLGP